MPDHQRRASLGGRVALTAQHGQRAVLAHVCARCGSGQQDHRAKRHLRPLAPATPHDNGKSVLKLSVTYDAGEHLGANAGIGFQF